MFFWTKNSERRTLNFFKSTDYSQQSTDFGYAVYCRDVTTMASQKNTNPTKNETCQHVFIFKVTLTRLYKTDCQTPTADNQFSVFNFQFSIKKGCHPYKSNTPIMNYKLCIVH